MAADIEEVLKKVEALIKNNQAADAETLCRQFLDGSLSEPRMLLQLAIAQQAQSRFSNAIESYRAYLRHDPDHAGAQNNLAIALFRNGDLDLAHTQFLMTLKLKPDNGTIWVNFANLLYALGETANAEQALQRAAALQPEDEELNNLVSLKSRAKDKSANLEKLKMDRERQEKIYALVPNAVDFENLPMVSTPYLIKTAAPGYVSPTLTTDEYGFRSLEKDGRQIPYSKYLDIESAKGIVCGSSPVFGYGLTDSESLHSRLTDRSQDGTLWYSLAIPVSNIVQQRYAVELFAPRELDYLVAFVGGMAVFMALLSSIVPEPYPPLYGVRTAGKRRERTSRLYDGTPVADIDSAFEIGTRTVCDNMRAMESWCRARSNTRVLFCCMPVLSLLDKSLTPEEETLSALFYEKQKSLIALRQDPSLEPRWRAFDRTIAATAGECGADFIDLANDEIYNSQEWLFLDQFHPSKDNVDHIANRITGWAETQ